MCTLKEKNLVRRLLLLSAALAIMIFSGCTVGHDYVRPDIVVPPTWRSEIENGLATSTMDPQILASWWNTFNDPKLSDLIEQAMAGNLDLETARSRVREARARRAIAKGGLLPAFSAGGSATSSRTDTRGGIDTSGQLYSTSLDAGWELDIFGGIRRSVEAATADVNATEENLRDVLVTLSAEVVLNYVEVRTFQARITAAEESLSTQEQTYQLVMWRAEAGLDDELAAEQAKYNLENTRSQIPSLRTGLQEAMNRIAVLLGQAPGPLAADIKQPRPVPVPPKEIAIGVPADAMRRRPDVRRAERELAAQTARVGVAVADLYPKLGLNGSIGLETLSFREPASSLTSLASGGLQLSWAILDPTIRPNIEVQSELEEQALIQYKSVLLSSLEEVENALVAYAQEHRRREYLQNAKQAAQAAAEMAQFKYQGGLVDFTTVLDAERSLLSFQDQLRQSDGAVTSNVIRLYKALGGGWTSMEDNLSTPVPVEQL